MTDLLPCPFCGDNKPFTYEDWPDWYVQCDRCDARTGNELTESDAVTAWNTRSQLSDIVGALTDAREAIASLETEALGMALPGFGIPGRDEYPIRDELLAKIDAALSHHKQEDRSNVPE